VGIKPPAGAKKMFKKGALGGDVVNLTKSEIPFVDDMQAI
jgi:hypothetical protein